ncbi:zinc ABC transporter permease [Niveispirillum lacus]|uniref:Zinc ABC transporter permease n=1 Tax=Niveispirillum lacus TaxID=1981099 RepID=A0A255YT56_9PROT|nr:metal ABC transporter permease [Niveispirillum lacus]OYQ32361.1 zinc ABC transporter permease [Niveispirillum lacus]
MTLDAATFLSVDLPALLAALFACLSCALVGNFLVLRRQALMGDAISHAVLPGIVAGFLVAGTRDTVPMLAGALTAALVAGVMIELVRRLGRVEAGAAMGVVFTGLFALGVVLIEQGPARQIDLDADCVLYGQLEAILWLAPNGWSDLTDPALWATLPRQVVQLVAVFALCLVIILIFLKELTLVCFDPALADTLGLKSGLVQHGIVGLAALAAIAAFEAVGSILVIAMLICPAATARLYTDRMGTQLVVSLLVGGVTGLGGYALAAFGPSLLGYDMAVNAAGSIAVLAGVILGLSILLAPRYGVLARATGRAMRGAAA